MMQNPTNTNIAPTCPCASHSQLSLVRVFVPNSARPFSLNWVCRDIWGPFAQGRQGLGHAEGAPWFHGCILPGIKKLKQSWRCKTEGRAMCVPAAYLVLVVRPLNILDLKSDQKMLKEKYIFFSNGSNSWESVSLMTFPRLVLLSFFASQFE